MRYLVVLILFVCCNYSCTSPPVDVEEIREEVVEVERYTSFVDQFAGTTGALAFPGATLPFGMVQVSPETGINRRNRNSGYQLNDSTIFGFTHTHLNRKPVTDLGNLLMMAGNSKKGKVKHSAKAYSSFTHINEKAEPGYYAIRLNDYEIKAEVTATKRVGLHKYIFPADSNSFISFDLGFANNQVKPKSTAFIMTGDSLITGYRELTGLVTNYKIYFAIQVSKPWKSYKMYRNGFAVGKPKVTKGKDTKLVLNYATEKGEKLLVKIGFSYVNIKGAIHNIQQEIPHWDFDLIRKAALGVWEEELSKMKVTSQDSISKKLFYTGIYQNLLAPVVCSDFDGSYNNYQKSSVNPVKWENDQYCTFPLTQISKSGFTLLSILNPKKANEISTSILDYYVMNGKLPENTLFGRELNRKGKNFSAVAILSETFLKGIGDFDIEKAYQIIKNEGEKYAYQNRLKAENMTLVGIGRSAGVPPNHIDDSYLNWCVAAFAGGLNREKDYLSYLDQSTRYISRYDSASGFILNEEIKETENQQEIANAFSLSNVNNWERTFGVKHDFTGLVEIVGGAENFNMKLDSFFYVQPATTEDSLISSFPGLYNHLNPNVQHMPYLYDYAGSPWKTQELVRKIMTTFYPVSFALKKNESDYGQLMSWYVFGALGFYPVNPTDGLYFFGSPIFEKIIIDINDTRKLEIVANNVSTDNKYIQAIFLNGKRYRKPFIAHKDLILGGKLEFVMGNQPNKNWDLELEAIPPSPSLEVASLTK
ncbi:GH92 family glycosyl hydrolase [Flexithrix dorotheae]|uniref:GH92 family glycosyl hydrolase n=1 Tax=Flexithrix dorotheae TaxID=70993 RepID=UPI00036E3B26|nr:GH92 family glycosyl hydrolase [Flexithrix dorotheae]